MKNVTTIVSIPFLIAPAFAVAHTGADAAQSSSQFLAGIVHAMTGLDHVVGAILAGICAALAVHKTNHSLNKAVPMLFIAVIAFLVSATLGSLLPASLANMAEWAVMASLIIMIGAIATGFIQRTQPLALAAVLITALASCHALAHGAEMATASLVNVTTFASGACVLLAAAATASAFAAKKILSRFKPVKY